MLIFDVSGTRGDAPSSLIRQPDDLSGPRRKHKNLMDGSLPDGLQNRLSKVGREAYVGSKDPQAPPHVATTRPQPSPLHLLPTASNPPSTHPTTYPPTHLPTYPPPTIYHPFPRPTTHQLPNTHQPPTNDQQTRHVAAPTPQVMAYSVGRGAGDLRTKKSKKEKLGVPRTRVRATQSSVICLH